MRAAAGIARFLLPALLAILLATGGIGAAAAPPPIELFPVAPAVDAQRGFAVAVDGDEMAVGAPLDDTVGPDAGAVHLFHWVAPRWEPDGTLYPDPYPDPPQPGAPPPAKRFGHALAWRDGVLAVGALGEGAVYVFGDADGEWFRLTKLSGVPGRYGRSVALGGGRLAVGEVAPHGEAHGTVRIYTPTGSSWAPAGMVHGAGAGTGDRFGQSLALDGDTLVVGDPADQGATGQVRVFTVATGQPPTHVQTLTAPGGQPGDQFGAAVALSGDFLAVGAPTADGAGLNAGAVYVSQRSEGVCGIPTALTAAALLPGDQLGTALALDGDLLAAGVPAPVTRDGRPGAVRAFWHDPGGWRELGTLQPGNGEPRDVTGFAVAVRGGRVAVGAPLGDQGGPAAGAAGSFQCTAQACAAEGEAAVPDATAAHPFGAAVALAGNLLAVGASPLPDLLLPGGAVYVYRRAGSGWRQEARLTSLHPQSHDSFGAAVALDGDTLAVGAPDDAEGSQVSPPTPDVGGVVYVFRRQGIAWRLEATLSPGGPHRGRLGAALALEGDTLAVGTPLNSSGTGEVVIFTRTRDASGEVTWNPTAFLTASDPQPGAAFGQALSLHGPQLAVGAPFAGAAYVFFRDSVDWSQHHQAARLLAPADVPFESQFGAAVSLGEVAPGNVELAVGAPESRQAFVFAGPSWSLAARSAGSDFFLLRFGAAVALRGGNLLVGAPGAGTPTDPPGRVVLFQRGATGWHPLPARTFLADPQRNGDEFGAALALDDTSFVVASPGPSAGDRVFVFPIPEAPP